MCTPPSINLVSYYFPGGLHSYTNKSIDIQFLPFLQTKEEIISFLAATDHESYVLAPVFKTIPIAKRQGQEIASALMSCLAAPRVDS